MRTSTHFILKGHGLHLSFYICGAGEGVGNWQACSKPDFLKGKIFKGLLETVNLTILNGSRMSLENIKLSETSQINKRYILYNSTYIE